MGGVKTLIGRMSGISAAGHLGKRQSPTLRVSLVGAMTLFFVRLGLVTSGFLLCLHHNIIITSDFLESMYGVRRTGS